MGVCGRGAPPPRDLATTRLPTLTAPKAQGQCSLVPSALPGTAAQRREEMRPASGSRRLYAMRLLSTAASEMERTVVVAGGKEGLGWLHEATWGSPWETPVLHLTASLFTIAGDFA